MSKINRLDFTESYFFSKKFWLPFLIIVGSVALAILVHYLLFRLLKYFLRKHESLTLFIEKSKFPVIIIFLILVVESVSPTATQNAGISKGLRQGMSILIILSIAWASIQAVFVARILFQKKFNISVTNNLKARKVHTQLRVLERIIVSIIAVIAICTILMTFENIRRFGMSLLASAGVAGLILGFAAQRSIATILAGFQIAFTQPIRIDDVVIVENEWGWVEEISLTYTVIRLWDKRRLIVPTTYFIEKPFQNWTRATSDIIGSVMLYIDYDVPIEELRKELTRLLEANSLWDREVNVLQVTDVTGSHVELRALVSAKDSSCLFDLRAYIREKMILFIQKNYPGSLPRTRVEGISAAPNFAPGQED